jgi:hypothetical protein
MTTTWRKAWLTTLITGNSVATLAAPAGSLFFNANPGTAYGDRSFSNVVWGDGYPTASLAFYTDPLVVFPPGEGGSASQRIANNGIAPGTSNNNHPWFVATYTNTLRLNALIADTGTVSAVYTFASPMTLIDLIVCDVDDLDNAVISATGADDQPLAMSNFILFAEGDLSMTNNAGSRPPLELATPPVWNAVSGVLSSSVSWNENRSFTVLRVNEGTAVKSIRVDFTGYRTDTDGPGGSGLGAHIYVNVWASPRVFAWTTSTSMTEGIIGSIPTLPLLHYQLEISTNGMMWETVNTVTGAAAPVATMPVADPDWIHRPGNHRWYRISQFNP